MRYAPTLGILLAVSALLIGCGKGSPSGPAGGGGTTVHQVPDPDTCLTPQEGCECDEENEVVECGIPRKSDGYTACTMGERVCSGGVWGPCEGETILKVPDPEPGQQAQALGVSKACLDNPCDPYCQVVADDSNNLMVGTGLDSSNGLTLKAQPPMTMGVQCTGITVSPASQTLTVTAINSTTGLLGEYYNQKSTSITSIPAAWTVTASRMDGAVNFDWGGNAPGPPGIGADSFSVRWSGKVVPRTTENYTFYTTSDDGARLWINGALVIDKWIDQGPTEYASNAIALTANTPVDIRFEYYENGGGATAQLRWSTPSIAKEVIPEGNLRPPGAALAPFVVSPTTATLTPAVQPPECYAGTLTAAWGLDKLDRAAVSSGGVVSLLSPVAGPISVSAYVQNFSATGTVNVVVNAVDSLEAPPGAATTFAGAASGADTATILYPYDATVFPLALKPPVLQWDTGGNAATAVKVSLVYPASGTPTFSWSKIIPSPSNSRFTFSREQWGFFERTAKGGTGKILLQRIVGGVLKNPVSKTVVFASTPLRGKIFYTQYGGGSKIMRLDPSGDNAAVNAFATDNGCPVCHSMSANGNKFATSNSIWSTNAGISNVDAAGNLTVLSDFPNPNNPYADGGSDWRGFAWAPFTPDGKYILATNNIYGNTRQQVVGINPTTRVVELPVAMVSGGRGTGLQADYYSTNNWTGSSWQRIDPRPDFSWTASPGGPIPADLFSAAWSGTVEGYFSEQHTFEVQTSVGVRLTVGGTVIINQLSNSGNATFTGNANLTRGAQTNILLELQDKSGQNPKVQLYWSSASLAKQLIPQSQLFPANGQRGAVVKYTDSSSNTVTRLESDMAYDWGGSQPVRGSGTSTLNINADNFTTTWDALVESPVTGNATWCINSDDGYTVKVGATTVLTSASSTGNSYVCSASTTAVTAGTKYAVHVDHTEGGGSARMKLAWKFNSFITTTEDIPSARIYPPSTWSVPTSGLSATFYDTMDFGGATVPQNSATPQAFATYVPNLDYDWGGDRFAYGKALTSSDTMSGRFTGRLQPACTGVHEFEIFADDTSKIWIGGERLIDQGSWGTRYAARWLDSALLYDFKADFTEDGGGAGIRIKWKPACNGATSYAAIPSSNFKPTGDTTLNGYLRQGGDNGNGYPYYVWQTPDTVGAPPVDVTSQSPGNWGLGQTVMMVPTFSPDGKKLVFVDGDSATNAGWRKGLSTFDFDQATKLFKNRRQMVNTFPAGDVIKWPTYESDSKSVIYQTTTPGDVCCRNPWTLYGYMGPTNYFEDPGKLWSIDTSAASPSPVALDKLNNGERAVDRNKSYQATMLPTPAGGYRWAVFTSTRPYGNTINLPAVQQDYSNTNSYTSMTNAGDLQSMLWVSAIDDAVSAGSDRSHPAFFLPNQMYSESGGHYLNERAYWVTEACRPAGNTAASACDVDEDCCGGTASPKTGVCRIDTPITSPPTRHCASVPPPNACIAEGGACTSNADCCFSNPCVANVCTKPPSLPAYYADNFARMYTSECGKGTFPVWRFFDWKAETPNSTTLEIYAESSDDPAAFHTVPVAPTAVAIAGVVKIATISGATIAGWVGDDVGAKLKAAGYPQRKYLMITVRFIPNATNTATPKLSDWRQSYSCPPAE